MKITVIVPTYNESKNIEQCISILKSVLQRTQNISDYKILITDAKSPDGTSDIVKKIASTDSHVDLIIENTKQGLGMAYIQAMQYAFNELKTDAVITFDADMSHDANKIPLMVNKLQNGFSYVIGSRYIKGGGIPEKWGLHRKFLSYFGNLYTRILYFNYGISDFTSGFRALKKDVFDSIQDKIVTHKGYTFSISVNLEALRCGYKVAQIPYVFKDRVKGDSKMESTYMINAFIFVTKSRILDVLQIRFLRVFIVGGIGATSQLITYGLVFFPLIEYMNVLNLPSHVYVYNIDFASRFFVSQWMSIEIGVLITFLINNSWSFRDKKLHGLKLLRGFLKTHFVVMGAILIQLAIAQILEVLFGGGIFKHYIYIIIGILVGLIWNYHFYKKIIWKTHKN